MKKLGFVLALVMLLTLAASALAVQEKSLSATPWLGDKGGVVAAQIAAKDMNKNCPTTPGTKEWFGDKGGVRSAIITASAHPALGAKPANFGAMVLCIQKVK